MVVEAKENIKQRVPDNRITILQADCTQPLDGILVDPLPREFDVITAMCIIDHAENQVELDGFASNMYAHCKVGGKVVASMTAAVSREDIAVLHTYGIYYEPADEDFENKPFRKMNCTLKTKSQGEETESAMMLLYSPNETFEQTFLKAGFREFKWVPLTLPEETPEKENWSAYMAHPAVRQFIAVK